MNDPQKLDAILKEQAKSNSQQHLLNALEAAGEALTLAAVLLERTAAQSQEDIDSILEALRK